MGDKKCFGDKKHIFNTVKPIIMAKGRFKIIVPSLVMTYSECFSGEAQKFKANLSFTVKTIQHRHSHRSHSLANPVGRCQVRGGAWFQSYLHSKAESVEIVLCHVSASCLLKKHLWKLFEMLSSEMQRQALKSHEDMSSLVGGLGFP